MGLRRYSQLPTALVISRTRQLLFQSQTTELLTSVASGMLLLGSFLLLVTRFGTSPLVCGVYAGAILSALAIGSLRLVATMLSARTASSFLILALLATAIPWILTLICLVEIPPIYLSVGGSLWGLTLPVVLASPTLLGSNESSTIWSRLSGIGLGCLLIMIISVSAGSVQVGLMVAAGMFGMVFGVRMFADSRVSQASAVQQPANFHVTTRPDWYSFSQFLLMGIAAGLSFAIATRYLAQLMPYATWVAATQWGMFFLLLGLSVNVISRWSISRSPWPGLLATMGLLGLFGGFLTLVSVSMWISASISSPVLLMALRSVVILVLVLPSAIWMSMLIQQSLVFTSSFRSSLTLSFGWSLFVLAALVGKISIIPLVGMNAASLIVVGISFYATLMSIMALRSWNWTVELNAKLWRQPLSIAMLSLLLAISVGILQPYKPQVAAQLLFSSQVFDAYRQNRPFSDLLVMTDLRHDTTLETSRGTLSTLTVHAHQWQVRKNGIPSGMLSLAPLVTPQSSADVVTSLLPLILHQAPRRIEILGVQAGTSLRTVLACPVQSVVLHEADAHLLSAIRGNAMNSLCGLDLEDRRLTIDSTDPLLANFDRDQRYDVILSFPEHSALLESAGGMTREYYRQAQQRLDEAGLFAQRFQTADYGSTAVCLQLKTLSDVFKHVACFEIAPGEMLLVGTDSDQALFRGDLFARSQKLHVQSLLAEMGWDWSVLFNLPYVGDEQRLAENFKTVISQVTPNTSLNCRAACRFPIELIRWGDKRREIQTQFATCSAHLLSYYEDDLDFKQNTGALETALQDQLENLQKRLKDITRREALVAAHPDEPWVYRTEIKTQIQQSPRSQILPAKGEGLKRVIHADDQRRLDYFEALGKCLNAPQFNADDYFELRSYLLPFDPLVSEFVHAELARICQQQGTSMAFQELLHRMHGIYFCPRADRSVRDAGRCIELVSTEDIADLSATQKYDILNGLLDILKNRWETRAQMPPLSDGILLNDIGDTLHAAQLALETMNRLQPEVKHVDSSGMLARSKFIDKELIKPLMSYRGDILDAKSKPKPEAE